MSSKRSSGQGKRTITEASLARLAQTMLRALKIKDATLDIVLLRDREMAAIKWQLLKKKTEPNVLSFPEPRHFPHPEARGRYLGEIYLNRDILRRAPSRAAPLLAHGLLHLLGHDHQKTADRQKMERKERAILKNLVY